MLPTWQPSRLTSFSLTDDPQAEKQVFSGLTAQPIPQQLAQLTAIFNRLIDAPFEAAVLQTTTQYHY